ncbi:hypothetical protein [Helicobacter sp. MIT 01-3238]|uniref:hypothetical protein n=1 Tax=Helicobacter sp. MIT 01-3238 TaxID=398627 RepID=UPI000E1F37B4|nr:hypothetical protein [Helicobacter sp. MIT 01-3238]RDU52918.1 hypothetical protein CQA40_06350 [Helicobacter sp. MIT 01-3238]
MSKLDFLKNNTNQEKPQSNEDSLQSQMADMQKRIEQIEEDFEILAQHLVQIGQMIGYIKNPRDKEQKCSQK